MTSAPPRLRRQVRLPLHIVDLAGDELRTASGDRVELRPRSWAVLRLLAEQPGRMLGKDDIISRVWDDVAVTEDSLTQCIVDIRKAIGDEERRVLRTVPRKGYMLVPSQQRTELAARAPDLPSLAVMPFLSIGEECGPLSLGSGVASEIINEFARNRHLRLIARDSSFALAGQNLMAQELGERLGARYLVEGTAQQAGGTLIVDVQIVDARDGSIAWGDRFSARASNVRQVQQDIAGRIAGSLHPAFVKSRSTPFWGRRLAISTSTSSLCAALPASISSVPRRPGREEPISKRRFAATRTMRRPMPISLGSI